MINASGTQQQYRYDCAGRLAQVLDASGNVLATYSYGASNQRLMSVEGGVTKYFAWAGGKIIAEYEPWGANALIWKKSYVYLDGRLLATTSGADGTETRFHHPDGLGTRLVTDAGGTVVSEQLSMPFGTMLPFTQNYGGENSYQHPTLSNPSKKRFTSYDRSDVTELDYAVNRFYSPQQGRFTQVDPIGMSASSLSDPQTLNMYAYCGNDPINRVDPDGLIWGFFKAIGRALVTIFTNGSGGSSGPGFQTPPTFPGSLPGITAAARSGQGGFRTPPFVRGFLASEPIIDIGFVLRIDTWEWSGVGALSSFLQFQKIKVSKQVYDTAEAAAIAALRAIIRRSIKEDREYAGRICQNSDGKFIYTGPHRGTEISSNPLGCPTGTTDAGNYHTHGAYDQKDDLTKQGGVNRHEVFNEQDRSGIAAWGTPGWLGTPTGRILKFTPQRGQRLTPGVPVKGITEDLTKKYGNLLSK